MKVLKKKWFKYTLIGLGVVALAVMIFLGLDYKNYRDYQQSQFFGSQDTVPQDYSLFFDGVKFTVTGVEHKEFPKATQQECDKALNQDIDLNLDLYEGDWEAYFSAGTPRHDYCEDRLGKYRNRKQVDIHYFIENTKNQPVSIAGYSARIIGSDDIKNNKPKPKITDLIAGQSRYSVFNLNVPRGAEDFALVVKKDGKQKQINIDLPELKES